jgi:hypothetical protein
MACNRMLKYRIAFRIILKTELILVPNVTDGQVALVLRVRGVPGLNRGPDVGFRDLVFFMVFLSSSRQVPR